MQHLNLPNALSLGRLMGTPALFWLAQLPDRRWVAAWFALLGITDALDGYLARRWQQTSDFGSRLDGLADLAFYPTGAVLLLWLFPQYLHANLGYIGMTLALLLADLGVVKTHSRPRVSNDNPYSESHFKTLKYRHDFPDFFGSLEDARTWVKSFFDWYNREHYHSSLGLLTPATVHYGQAASLLESRQLILDEAYAAHPERFVRKPPTVQSLPEAVWINRPQPLLEAGAEPPFGV